jgi:hypothetical protein
LKEEAREEEEPDEDFFVFNDITEGPSRAPPFKPGQSPTVTMTVTLETVA